MYQTFLNWISTHMLPCGTKFFFGVSCPMCGFQRGTFQLLEGNVGASIKAFPPLFVMLFSGLWFGIKWIVKKPTSDTASRVILIALGISFLFNFFWQNWGPISH